MSTKIPELLKKAHWHSFFILLLFLQSCSTNQTTVPIVTAEPTQQTNAQELRYTTAIRSIFQDSKGNYWFGSHQEGVCLFTGTTFTYFNTVDGLSDNQIRTIQEDANGNIWFNNDNGINSYNGVNMINQTMQNPDAINTIGEWGFSKSDLWFDAGNDPAVYRFDGEKLTYLALPIQNLTGHLIHLVLPVFLKVAKIKFGLEPMRQFLNITGYLLT